MTQKAAADETKETSAFKTSCRGEFFRVGEELATTTLLPDKVGRR